METYGSYLSCTAPVASPAAPGASPRILLGRFVKISREEF
jgi:hypothetical protein